MHTKFSLEDYVNSQHKITKEQELQENYEDLLKSKETFRQNTKNLLKNFDEEFKLSKFNYENNVLNYFPLYKLNTNQIYNFLQHINSLKLKDNKVGNKVISNIKKINIDNNDIELLYIKPPKESNFQNNSELLSQDVRLIIRTKEKIKEAKRIIEAFQTIVKKLKESNNLADFEGIVYLTADTIMQMVTYWVITVGGSKEDPRKPKVIKIIKDYLINFEKEIDSIETIDPNLELSDIVTIYCEFLKQYNLYGVHKKVTQKLIDEQTENPEYFGIVKDEYKVKKRTEYTEYDYKNVILEGEEINDFEDKFTKSQKAIEILQKHGATSTSTNDMFDLKVYFREIYISNSKHKTKASTIIRKMINADTTEFSKTTEYMFIREKITRGCFREMFPLTLYKEKVEIEHMIYKILLKIMLFYNYHQSLDYLEKLVTDITPICYTIIDDEYEKKGYKKIFH